MKLTVDQQRLCNKSAWCYGMWFVGREEGDPESYLSNDGRLFPYMQRDVLDCNGGTYHLTQQDAQASLDRYLQKVSHADCH